MNNAAPNSTTRRDFIKKSSTAVAGGVLAPHIAIGNRAYAANADTLRVGLIGCGGRGTGAAAQALSADPNCILTSMADVFEGQIQSSLSTLKATKRDRVQVTPEKMFVGLDGFEKVINSGVDVVILATPPGFRPPHFKAAVDAGKHVFIEKPMATDAPGVRSVMESVRKSKEKNLSVVAGYCWRYDYARREFFKRLADGAIGDVRAMYATYYTGPVKPMPPESQRKPEWSDAEWQIRNWYNFVWLSGDSLVEQAVHSADKIAWAFGDQPPIKAVAVGGRQIPANGGNIFDHFEVNYEYANGARAFLASRQQSGCFNQNADYVIGSNGQGTIGVRPAPELTGGTAWRYNGPRNDMYQTEHDELFASIRAGKPLNDGDRMCTSTLLAILGRMAAYTGREITWEEALNSKDNLFPEDLTWDSKLEMRPMAMPGITPFI